MATKMENLARVGSAIQMGAMIAQMADSNSTGMDDKIGKIAQQIGAGCVRVASGNVKTGAGLIRTAAEQLTALADEMEAEGK